MLDQIAHHCYSHFLCRFDPRSKKRRTKDVIREVAAEFFTAEVIDEFIEERLDQVQKFLVEEFNARTEDKAPLRFQIADDAAVGSVIRGYEVHRSASVIRFQDALHRVPVAEFEKLTAVILKLIGCRSVFLTPSSHDQGVDAFGYRDIIRRTPYGIVHKLTWIAQAKHYLATKVGTSDIRELVGSKELLVSRVFSTVDERYTELRLRPYAPTAIAFVTTEEIPTTVRRVAGRAGIYVFAASDLHHFLWPYVRSTSASAISRFIAKQSKAIPNLQ
jgi:hypothetical protein